MYAIRSYYALDALLNGNPSAVLEGSMFYGMHTNILIFGGFLVLLLFFKVIATSVTNGAGGVGGIFAPTLFMGGVAGYLIARLVNLLGFSDVPERNFTLVGMAGMIVITSYSIHYTKLYDIVQEFQCIGMGVIQKIFKPADPFVKLRFMA